MQKQYKESYPSGPDKNNKAKSREELTRIISQLRDSLSRLSWYVGHSFGCEVDYTDYCTCGKTSTMDKARKLYEETRYV